MREGIRYGNTVVYNTFPVPLLTEQNKADLTACAENILLAREAHFPATLADLYDPDTMPESLRRAHERNDEGGINQDSVIKDSLTTESGGKVFDHHCCASEALRPMRRPQV